MAVTEDKGSFDAGAEIGEVEAFKAISDLYIPVRGEVIGRNETLGASPEQINSDPYGTGWVALIKPDAGEDLSGLMTADGYRALIGAEDV